MHKEQRKVVRNQLILQSRPCAVNMSVPEMSGYVTKCIGCALECNRK